MLLIMGYSCEWDFILVLTNFDHCVDLQLLKLYCAKFGMRSNFKIEVMQFGIMHKIWAKTNYENMHFLKAYEYNKCRFIFKYCKLRYNKMHNQVRFIWIDIPLSSISINQPVNLHMLFFLCIELKGTHHYLQQFTCELHRCRS